MNLSNNLLILTSLTSDFMPWLKTANVDKVLFLNNKFEDFTLLVLFFILQMRSVSPVGYSGSLLPPELFVVPSVPPRLPRHQSLCPLGALHLLPTHIVRKTPLSYHFLTEPCFSLSDTQWVSSQFSPESLHLPIFILIKLWGNSPLIFSSYYTICP